MEIEIIALGFIVLGALLQTALQFCYKVLKAPEGTLKFDARYFATLIASIILAVMGALALFAVFTIPVGLPVAYVIASATAAGFTVNVIVNVNADTFAVKKTQPQEG